MDPLAQPLFRRLLAGLFVLLAAAPALAERADRDKPMNIESDTLRYEEQKQLSTFTGRVVVTKGTIVMRGARLEVRQDAAGNQNGTMFAEPGGRAFFRQKREGLNEYIEGEGETIEYDGKADSVRFVRRAEMRRLAGATLQDEVMGSVIVYNNTTEVYTVDGAPRSAGAPSSAPGGRVRAVLAPRGQGGAAAPAAGESAPAPAVPLRPSTTLPAPGPAQ
ncbi:lipopolysaccharide transport periplasmic protein LptA [Ottowia sp.]|uniref:lipopolysaccharide transport periplasmic protein LptA n=1 Tax=Ottowia sp. TaxID=1898956 RepID=UPI0025F56D89|nr:lipopolysaccharide transport periplasmic protein LptA [Ottowia sp.]MBK6614637.1 lipopolysaccharide transport periplasmic protein LptA [Ottowia sp.]MBK6745725.1 lipopolysaccharide transport periplasmic protein LptA [Ottowia sp.]